ncbi:MAG: hypothetical protein ACE5I1_22050 [bacterium]
MRKHPYAFLAMGICTFTILTACGGNNELTAPEQLQAATSQICQNISGAPAIFWDMSNGIIRADLPGGVPTVKNIGGTFFHEAYPPLSFIYPTGWTPETLAAAQTAGVNLIRQDNRAVWRWLGTAISGVPGPRQIRDFEVNQLLQFFQVNQNVETVCVNEGTNSPAPGIQLTFSSILVRSGGFTAVVGVQVTSMQGLPASQVVIQVSAGPTNEYDELIFDVYLAIGFQLLYGKSSISDSDGDGTPDTGDNFPFDPTRT